MPAYWVKMKNMPCPLKPNGNTPVGQEPSPPTHTATTQTAEVFRLVGSHMGRWQCKDEQYPHDVAMKKPNPWGLYDMHGNVYEWCSNWYGAEHYGKAPMEDPTGPEEGIYRVLRTGGWTTYASFCRFAIRFPSNPPDHRHQHVGFRGVLNVGLAPQTDK
jgi:formylglycine-generating enzyme required for sulfatase activity